jgi:hypothetical protein
MKIGLKKVVQERGKAILIAEDTDLNIELVTQLLVGRDEEQGVGMASECHGE